jgi:hypothetical protein
MSGSSTPTVATSPAAAFSSDPFSDAEKVDIRRFCGYETYGGPGSAGFQSWRFFQIYGLLEFRMTNLAPTECQNVRYYLSMIYPLESAVPTSTMDTDQAAVWFHNKNEVRDRMSLLTTWCKRLCGCVGIPPGPLLGGGGSTIRLVV